MKLFLALYLASLSISFVSCVSPLKSYRKALAKGPYDAVIIPGIPYQDENWESNVMKNRVVWSLFLYRKGIARNLIYSGDAVYSPYVEGKIMAIHAIALGIPKEHVFSETRAHHSTENLVYSYRMAKKMGFKKIGIATDPFQSSTLKTYAWDYAIKVAFIPIVYDSIRFFTTDALFKIDPSPAFVNPFVPLPQRENIFKRISGTLGLDIKNEESE